MPRRALPAPGLFSTWRQERSRLLGRARRRGGSAADAEDVVQYAAVTALVRASALRDAGKAEAWVARIVDRKASDATRARGRYARLRGDLDEARDVAHEAAAAPCFCVRAQARLLPPIYAEVLERVDERGERIAAVAGALGLSTNALTVRLSRARAKLRATLAEHCGTTRARSCNDCGCAERRCCAPVEDGSVAAG